MSGEQQVQAAASDAAVRCKLEGARARKAVAQAWQQCERARRIARAVREADVIRQAERSVRQAR